MQPFLQCLKGTFSVFILAAFIFSACEKDKASLQKQNGSSDHLAFEHYFDNTIRINQAITVYDSTEIRDSIDYVHPPSDKYYEWHVMPANGCDSIIGDKNKGMVSFSFHCPGNYLITADIYDSLKHNLIGNTDTVAITVTMDTLPSVQNIKLTDVLTLQHSIVGYKLSSDTNVPYNYYVSFLLQSSESYIGYTPYIHFNIDSSMEGNSYMYSFSNIVLDGYPFLPGPYGTTDHIGGGIQLPILPYGTATNITIEWLGKTYTGTVTLADKNNCIVNWDNSGAVKMY